MPKDAVLHVRVPQELKDDAETILVAAGLSTATAVRCLLLRVVEDRRLPFEIFPPSDERLALAHLELKHRASTYPRSKRCGATTTHDTPR